MRGKQSTIASDGRNRLPRSSWCWRWLIRAGGTIGVHFRKTCRHRHGAEPPASQPAPTAPSAPPAVTILNNHDVEGILGREVLSAANENMGRIVDVIVDRSGQVRAAIIDFGGFLGVGSRKIAVDWNALHFPPPGAARRQDHARTHTRPGQGSARISGGKTRRRPGCARQARAAAVRIDMRMIPKSSRRFSERIVRKL